MNLQFVLRVAVCALVFLTTINAAAQELSLSPAEKALLDRRTGTAMMIGTFRAYSSYLYSVRRIVIHTDNPEVATMPVKSTFPSDYQATWREVFDSLAKQTGTTWSFDRSRKYWLFSKPLPFQINLASGWKFESRDGYISYRPPSAPVGMDIYFAGALSQGESASAARERIAVKFGKPIKEDLSVADMSLINLPGGQALFYKTTIVQTGINWRQWAFVELGKAFVIVSAIKPEHENEILPNVESMVSSFKVTGDKSSGTENR